MLKGTAKGNLILRLKATILGTNTGTSPNRDRSPSRAPISARSNQLQTVARVLGEANNNRINGLTAGLAPRESPLEQNAIDSPPSLGDLGNQSRAGDDRLRSWLRTRDQITCCSDVSMEGTDLALPR